MADWMSDALWMTGYFSVGVWTSIWLAVAQYSGGGEEQEEVLVSEQAARKAAFCKIFTEPFFLLMLIEKEREAGCSSKAAKNYRSESLLQCLRVQQP